MNFDNLREGIIVNHHHVPVEVLSYDHVSNLVEVKRVDTNEHFSTDCDELQEDPQLHTDCMTYY
ncbi:MAG: hypothetical protein AAGJ37_12195 [Pseudomonadota bacterium]